MGSVSEHGTTLHPTRATSVRAFGAWAGRWVSSASYLKKWSVLGVVIGAVAGLGAIVFYEALVLSTHFFLNVCAGYQVPTPAGEGGLAASSTEARPWALPLIAGAGALLGAVLVFRIAPEAEGHGTDAAISAVHHNPRGVRFRVVVVKIVASALTIGSGGSGGREGPTGQISAGFGSLLARILDLEPADGRIAVATGIGSGIGAIFGAPLGGAVLASEVLYRDDFDPAALLPSFIASVVSFVVFGAAEGFSPLFGYVKTYHFTDPIQLVWFALIGLLAGLIGLLYAKGFYGLADVFTRAPLPRWAAPAIGGVMVGAIAIAIPQVIGTGYGWVQQCLTHNALEAIPLWIVLIVPFARILATGLSIGSGGSGGIFGPGIVIGAFLGAAVWRVFDPVFPSVGHDPAPYVIVGMMSCFGGISRAPLAVMLMVAEMTGSLSILTPAMIAVGISWLIVRRGDDTIYRSQLRSRSDAPSQRLLAGLPLLAAIPVTRAMAEPSLVVAAASGSETTKRALDRSGHAGAPVVDENRRFAGTIARSMLVDPGIGRPVGDFVDAGAPTVSISSRLDVALESLTEAPQSWLPVLDHERRVVGTLSVSDVVRAYRQELLSSAERISELGTTTGATLVTVNPGSPLTGKRLRHAGLPPGLLVTSLSRGDKVFFPTGDDTLEIGDHLTVIGRELDLSRLGDVSSIDPDA